VHDRMKELKAKLGHGPMAAGLEPLHLDLVNKIWEKPLTFERAQQLRQELEQTLEKQYAGDSFHGIRAEIRGIGRQMNETLLQEAEKEGARLDMPGMEAKIRAEALSYHHLKIAEEALEISALQEKNRNFFSIRDAMVGAAVGGAASATIGDGGFGAITGAGMGIAKGMAVQGLSRMGRKELDPALGHAMYWMDSRGGKGLLAIEQAYKEVGEKLGKFTNVLSGKGVPEFREVASRTPAKLVATVLGHKDLPKNKYEMSDKLFEKIDDLRDNPGHSTAVADARHDVYGRDAPNIAEAAKKLDKVKIEYLASAIPRAHRQDPFGGKFRPSDLDLENFYAKLEVAENWVSVMGHMDRQSLRPAHVDAMAAMYPAILADIRKKATEWASEQEGKPIPYRMGLMLSVLMEQRIDPSLDSAASIQAIFGEQQQNKKQPNKIQRHTSRMPQIKDIPQLETETSRITYK
jgi:hypothetical protein